MRKSTIVVMLGLLIVITALLCIGSEDKIYRKEKHFNSPSEVLEQLGNNKLMIYNKRGGITESKQFSECLSLRKRIAGPQIHYGSINNIEIKELSEKQKKSIKDNYINSAKNLVDYEIQNNIEAVRIKVDVKYPSTSYDQESQSRIIDMVFIDEGEGTVIDYFVDYSIDQVENIKEGNQDVKG